MDADSLQVGTQFREVGDRRRDHRFGEGIWSIDREGDGGGSGGNEQGDERDELLGDAQNVERFQIREQKFVGGLGLESRKYLLRQVA